MKKAKERERRKLAKKTEEMVEGRRKGQNKKMERKRGDGEEEEDE